MIDRPLTVLLLHNRYLEPGGEEAVYQAEGRLLESLGHRVVRYEVGNERVAELSTLTLGARTVWSVEAHRQVARLVREARPDVAHVHNTLPLLSPSVHHAISAAGVPVVQTLHNYRLLCPQGMLLRDGHTCVECVGRWAPVAGVLHGCYRDSRLATAAVAAMLTVHRALRTWTHHVDAFIALSNFARARFLEGGLPADRLHVKPNFVSPDPGTGRGNGAFLLFVGRLAPEKGIETLLEAWRRATASTSENTAAPSPRLVIVGDGPLSGTVRDAAATLPGLRWEGRQPHERVLELMGRARALVFPSLCFENSPGVVLEAYARALPVLASELGSTAELVRDGVTGRLFSPGDPHALAELLRWSWGSPSELDALRVGARASFEATYTARASAERLLHVYDEAVRHRARPASGGAEAVTSRVSGNRTATDLQRAPRA